jgi:hypothetical protein
MIFEKFDILYFDILDESCQARACVRVFSYLKADFQSSHEAPRSSLRVMHEHFHPITMLNSSF